MQFAVTFSQSVTGVDPGDFALALSAAPAGTIDSVSGSGTAYTVTVNNVVGDGTLGLNLVDDDSIVDLAWEQARRGGDGQRQLHGPDLHD